MNNLATGIEIHAWCTGAEAKMAEWLRTRANALALGQAKLLESCEAGVPLEDAERKLVQRDLRLADNAASAVPVVGGGYTEELCVMCAKSPATMLGFACRCQCLCRECAAKSGQRIQECPKCGDFTEFVAA